MIHVGIDIGKSVLAVAQSHPTLPPHKWRCELIRLDDANWHHTLRALVPAGAIVTAEPTGTHYLTPILTALRDRNVTIWQVPTTTTKHIRAVHISSGKSDRTDAQALALIATWIAQGRHVHGAYPLDIVLNDEVAALRALINAHARMTRSRTRLLNQLDQLGHSLWPALAQAKIAWLRAVSADAITPDEVRALAARDDLATLHAYRHPAARAALRKLAATLPDDVPASPRTRASIADLHDQVLTLTAQIAQNAETITTTVQRPPYEDITARWMTVPYAVPKTGELPGNLIAIATLHVATKGRADTFSRDEFKAAIGAHPKTRQSGDRITRERVKKGYRPAMVATRMWTLTLVSPRVQENPIRRYYASVKSPYRMQAAVGKLARILHAVARDPAGYRVQ